MTRTNIDLDDDAVVSVMTRFGFATKRDAVNFALRQLAVEPLSREKALELEGTGWEGDLAGMREHRAS